MRWISQRKMAICMFSDFSISIPREAVREQLWTGLQKEATWNCSSGFTKTAMKDVLPMRWIMLRRVATSKFLNGCMLIQDMAAHLEPQFLQQSMNKIESLEWLHHHYPREFDTLAMDIAAKHGKLHALKWFHDRRLEGCTTEAMDSSARNGYLEVVKWLHANRSEGCSPNIVDEIIKYDQLPMLEWWYANRSERCTTNAMDLAAEHGLVGILNWLHVQHKEQFSQKMLQHPIFQSAKWYLQLHSTQAQPQ
ncbi:hypothetical protein AC1031_011475 [Aphanomyces cochlioides]|nr:hypothetical protein AC1031_011475 [Aphanomyces cochlioides]